MKTITTPKSSRKTLVRLLAAALAISGAGLATAQQQPMLAPQSVVIAQQDLQEMVAPVALYPDALLAQTLVASTYPQDVVSAAAWLRDGGDTLWVDLQTWDTSVRGLVHEPDALYLLADNPDWMNALGDAFLNQQQDVMQAIQEVRRRAVANGVLQTNQYQKVVIDGQVIQILPADPQVIYVPVYEPQVIFAEPAYVPTTVVRFGVGIRVGVWLHHDFDWHDRAVYVGNWGRNRPWWNAGDRDGRPGGSANAYLVNRPGQHAPVVRSSGRLISQHVGPVLPAPDARWQRDARKPAPQPAARPVARVTPVRSTSPIAHPAPSAPPSYNRVAPIRRGATDPRPAQPVRTPVTINRPTPVRDVQRPTAPRTPAATTPAPVRTPASINRPTPVRNVERPTAPRTPAATTPAPVRTPASINRPTPVRSIERPTAPRTPAATTPAPVRTPASINRPTPVRNVERPAAPRTPAATTPAPVRNVSRTPARSPAPVIRTTPAAPSRESARPAPSREPATARGDNSQRPMPTRDSAPRNARGR